MPIKFKAKKDEIPAELQSFYVERDGSFVLDVDGAVEKTRVDEVRASNIALASQLAEQKKRFEAIESEQVKAITAERDALNSQLTAIQIDQGVTTVATKKGLRPTAIPDITARARSVFRLARESLFPTRPMAGLCGFPFDLPYKPSARSADRALMVLASIVSRHERAYCAFMSVSLSFDENFTPASFSISAIALALAEPLSFNAAFSRSSAFGNLSIFNARASALKSIGFGAAISRA